MQRTSNNNEHSPIKKRINLRLAANSSKRQMSALRSEDNFKPKGHTKTSSSFFLKQDLKHTILFSCKKVNFFRYREISGCLITAIILYWSQSGSKSSTAERQTFEYRRRIRRDFFAVELCSSLLPPLSLRFFLFISWCYELKIPQYLETWGRQSLKRKSENTTLKTNINYFVISKLLSIMHDRINATWRCHSCHSRWIKRFLARRKPQFNSPPKKGEST